MNIKIDAKLPDFKAVSKIPFGSRVYGTNRPDSDFDYVILTTQDLGESTYQWSGTVDGQAVDYTYTTLDNFYRTIKRGGNPVFFEALHFFNDPLPYYTYENARMYLGLAKRDLDYPERTNHVNRCIWMAEQIAQKKLMDLRKVKDLVINTDAEFLRGIVDAKRESLNRQFKKI